MSKVLGRQVKATKTRREPSDQFGDSSKEQQAAAMHRMFEWYDTHGLSGNPLVLRRVLGHESRTLLSFLEEAGPKKGTHPEN